MGGVCVALDELSIMEDQRAVHALGKFEIVGRDQSGQAFGANQCDERCEYASCGAAIEISGRFVGQQDARTIGQRAGDRHALLFAA